MQSAIYACQARDNLSAYYELLDQTPEAVRTQNFTEEGNVRNNHQKHWGISLSIQLITPVRVYDLQPGDRRCLG